MKQYNRTTKKYEEEVVNPKLKKRDTCKGGKPHDWVLTLPYGYEHIEGLYTDAEPVYAAEEALDAMERTLHEELEKVGIRRKFTYGRYSISGRRREYICSVCGKKHWGDL